MITNSRHIKVALFLLVASVQYSFAQESGLVSIAQSWLIKLDSINSEHIRISDRYISVEQIELTKLKIKKNLWKSLELFNEDKTDPEARDQLFMSNTNASLWWRQLGSNDFQAMIRRTIINRPVNKSVIQDLNSAYSKWLRKPTVKNLDRYSESLYDLGKSYEIMSLLQIRPVQMDGIVVKYQSINSDEVRTLKPNDSSSEIEKIIPVGNYRIWLEKDDKVITNRSEAYSCVASRQKVNLANEPSHR